jgi:hypothetical protein
VAGTEDSGGSVSGCDVAGGCVFGWEAAGAEVVGWDVGAEVPGTDCTDEEGIELSGFTAGLQAQSRSANTNIGKNILIFRFII